MENGKDFKIAISLDYIAQKTGYNDINELIEIREQIIKYIIESMPIFVKIAVADRRVRNE